MNTATITLMIEQHEHQ